MKNLLYIALAMLLFTTGCGPTDEVVKPDDDSSDIIFNDDAPEVETPSPDDDTVQPGDEIEAPDEPPTESGS